jgi:hypothetical protein
MDAGGAAAAAAANSQAGSLQRVDAHTLSSTVPASEFSLRAMVLAVQTPTTQDWLADLAALIATDAPAAAARAAHDDWCGVVVVVVVVVVVATTDNRVGGVFGRGGVCGPV